MHASNYGHNGVPPVSRDAALVDKQGPRLHPRLLGLVAPELRGAAADLGGHTRAQRPGDLADTDHAGKEFPIMPSRTFVSGCVGMNVAEGCK